MSRQRRAAHWRMPLGSRYRDDPWSLVGALILLLVVFGADAVAAQESVLALEFSFSNPGARSMGFGGAFGGLADDATAAFANPAGLVQITRPEVSVEGRRRSYTTPFTLGGRVRGEPTGVGIDTVAGLRIGESSQSVTGLSFLSFVYPTGRWSVALYRHESASFKFFGETQGLFIDTPTSFGTGRYADQRSQLDLEVEALGVAVSYRISDSFSLGVGLARYEGTLGSLTGLYGIDEPTLEAFFGEISYLPEKLRITETFTMDDHDVQATLGGLWRSSSGRWRLGGFVRPGAGFSMSSEARTGPAGPYPEPPGSLLARGEFSVSLPDVYGAGVAYRVAGENLTVSFEWNRIEYSDLLDGLSRVAIEQGEPPPILVEDGDEWHLGAEYAWLASRPIVAVRVGAWLDPDHTFRSTSDDPLDQALRQPGADEMHYAAGLGIAFSRFQIDLAADLSEAVDSVSLSAILGF